MHEIPQTYLISNISHHRVVCTDTVHTKKTCAQPARGCVFVYVCACLEWMLSPRRTAASRICVCTYICAHTLCKSTYHIHAVIGIRLFGDYMICMCVQIVSRAQEHTQTGMQLFDQLSTRTFDMSPSNVRTTCLFGTSTATICVSHVWLTYYNMGCIAYHYW